MLCPNCGSSKTELMEQPFSQTIKREEINGIINRIGMELRFILSRQKTEGQNDGLTINMTRNNGWVCHDCGNSFSKDNIPDIVINGYKIFITEQFISDYFRQTAKSDLKDLFTELRKKLDKSIKRFTKNHDGDQQFVMEIIISKIKYSLTCEIRFKEMRGISMEGLVRKR